MKTPPALLHILRLLALSALFIGLLTSCGGSAPSAEEPTRSPAQPEATALPPAVILPPAIPEERMLTLEFPPVLRAGDADVVRLTLEVDSLGNLTPTAGINGNTTTGQVVIIPNLYATHNVLAEARLDMAGMDVSPSGVVSETLLPGQKVLFYWSIRSGEVGKSRGTVWFYLRFVPKDGSPESRQALSAQVIEIETQTFFGLGADAARMLGLAGSALGVVVGLPFFEDVIKWLWNRRRKTA
jgi:hypothetical protein